MIVTMIKVLTGPDAWGKMGEAGRSPVLSRNCSNGDNCTVGARLPAFIAYAQCTFAERERMKGLRSYRLFPNRREGRGFFFWHFRLKGENLIIHTDLERIQLCAVYSPG